ncbi:LysE family translocator [Vibrio salinus]|uniref:LysE family translocator n=1 Tax=Vibrio salinus TaxID=2899784 RepID=UPI001E5C48F2|nr:LysE family translocator [Vibrio salinus]MCE0492934.1 LysE family translocator [Vibrio salinus]
MDYALFLVTCLAATFTPGPAVLLAVKNSTHYGVRKAMVGIVGNMAAMMTLAGLSAAGLSALLMASDTLFTVLKLIGGGYLFYIGIKTWSAKPNRSGFRNDSPKLKGRGMTNRKLFTEAYLTGVSNPKALLFYSALFPQFMDVNHPVFEQFSLLVLIFSVCSFSALLIYAVVAEHLVNSLSDGSVGRIFNRITGGTFMAFGGVLILSNRS